MPILVTALAALYGAAAGLLLPRAVHQLATAPDTPPRTACPEGHRLRGPLGLAYCTNCRADGGRAPYGPSTPLLLVVTSLLCAALAHATGARPELVVWLLITPPAIALAAIDLAVHRLPDAVTLPLAATAALLGLTALFPGSHGSWTRALLGAAAFAGGYFVLFLISPNGIGFGDVKLALTIGLVLGWHGWDAVLTGAFAGQLLAVLHGLVLAAAHKTGRKTRIPFGPGMLGGAYTALFLTRFI